jgi:hypothetical protein
MTDIFASRFGNLRGSIKFILSQLGCNCRRRSELNLNRLQSWALILMFLKLRFMVCYVCSPASITTAVRRKEKKLNSTE